MRFLSFLHLCSHVHFTKKLFILYLIQFLQQTRDGGLDIPKGNEVPKRLKTFLILLLSLGNPRQLNKTELSLSVSSDCWAWVLDDIILWLKF